MSRASRRRSLVCALALVALVVTGCGGGGSAADPPSGSTSASGSTGASTGAGPRPLTSQEAERLAIVRFNNDEAGVRSVTFVVTADGVHYNVDGWVDYKAGLGYATVSDDSGASQLIAWSASAISSYPVAGATGLPPLPPPGLEGRASSWTSSDLEPDKSRLHATLALLLGAGSDRPDNPQLLEQTDARWLRTDKVGETPVDVVAGPTSDQPYVPSTATTAPDGSDAVIRYWFDADNVLLRMEVRVGGTGDWTPIDFGDATGVDFADAFQNGA